MKSLLLLAPALLATTPATSQPRADTYRAVGTEPFWSLDIDRRTITYRPADGRAITVNRPRAMVARNGEVYRGRGLTVDIRHVRCSDGMSDQVYADTVKVTIGRRTLSGCGGGVVASESVIANTSWTLSAIDGRPVRLDRPATLAFTGDRIQGRICNSYSGGYRFDRGTLTTDRVVSTRMACAGLAGTTEAAFLRAVAQPLKVHRGTADTLVLSNGPASVTLRRQP